MEKFESKVSGFQKEIQIQPILVHDIQPVITKEIQPIINEQIQPVIHKEIQPIIHHEIQPVITKEIQPIIFKKIQPVIFMENQRNIDEVIQQLEELGRLGLSHSDKIKGTNIFRKIYKKKEIVPKTEKQVEKKEKL